MNTFLAITNLPTCGSTGAAVLLQEQRGQDGVTILLGVAHNQKGKNPCNSVRIIKSKADFYLEASRCLSADGHSQNQISTTL